MVRLFWKSKIVLYVYKQQKDMQQLNPKGFDFYINNCIKSCCNPCFGGVRIKRATIQYDSGGTQTLQSLF